MRSSLKTAMTVALALFVGSVMAPKAEAGITARIEKQKVNANLYKARLVATASHPGAGSVQYKSPWQYIYKNQSPKKHNVTILAFRFSSSLRWSSNKLIGNVTASVTVLGKTVRLSRTVTATVT